MVVLRSALHDRPVHRACFPANWLKEERPAALPDARTVSRQSRRLEGSQELRVIHRRSVEETGQRGHKAALDGRSLLVGGVGKDPTRGPVAPWEVWAKVTSCMCWWRRIGSLSRLRFNR